MQFPILFDIAFPSVFQAWLDALAVLALDVYKFAGIHCLADMNLCPGLCGAFTRP